MCRRQQCTSDAIAQQVLLSESLLRHYLDETVTLRIWYTPHLLFFSVCGTFLVLAACILSHPEYFAYSLFDEWDSYDRLFERADRVLQGAGNQTQPHADDERALATESRGRRQVEELLEEKPRHLPLLHRRWLQEAQSRFGAKLHALLAEYEECGTNIQRVCLSETATNLRDVNPALSDNTSEEMDTMSRRSED